MPFTWPTPNRCARSSSPANTPVTRRSSSMATLRMKSTPARRAISSEASWSGLPSSTPVVAWGCSRIPGPWRCSIVSTPTSPGATSLRPPEYPAMKCGSINPVSTLRSHSTYLRSTWMGIPVLVVPRSACSLPLRAMWLTMGYRSTTSPVRVSRSCASSIGACNPVATRMVISSGASPHRFRHSSSGGRIMSWGTGRVISETTTQAFRRPRAISSSGGPATGWQSASPVAATGSSNGGVSRMFRTATRFSSGTRTSRPDLS